MELESKIRRGTENLFEIPLPFWFHLLGETLNFHLGHFSKKDISLEDSLHKANINLINEITYNSPKKILDIGCGWGGPAFDLASRWNAKVTGLTISKQQANYVNEQSLIRKLPVSAKHLNVEEISFNDLGTFDVIWMYEVLEHIADRKKLFNKLGSVSKYNTNLAIAISCLAHSSDKDRLYNEYLGIQKLDTLPELITVIEDSGWKVICIRDYTTFTLPIWRNWKERLETIQNNDYREIVDQFIVQFEFSEKLFGKGTLRSIQLVAERKL